MIEWCTTLKQTITLKLLQERLPYNYYKRLFIDKNYENIFNNRTHQYFFPNFTKSISRGENKNVILLLDENTLGTHAVRGYTIPEITIKKLGLHVIKNKAMTIDGIDYTVIEKDEFNPESQLTYRKEGKTIIKPLSECNTPEYSYLINYLNLKENGVCQKLK